MFQACLFLIFNLFVLSLSLEAQLVGPATESVIDIVAGGFNRTALSGVVSSILKHNIQLMMIFNIIGRCGQGSN